MPEDRGLLLAVYASTRTEELACVDWDQAAKQAFLRMQAEAQDAYYRQYYTTCAFQVIVIDGVDSGRLYLDRWSQEHRLVDIALLPEVRGAGAGEAILRSLQVEADAAGKPLTVHVERFNPALRLYQRLGFRLVEDRGVYVFLEWRAGSSGESEGSRAG